MGEAFYRKLFANHPELLDYFKNADIDSLAVHVVQTIDLCVNMYSSGVIGEYKSRLRALMDHLGEHHRRLSIPSWGYPLVGKTLIELLDIKGDGVFSKDELVRAFTEQYRMMATFVRLPMAAEERMVIDAEEFFEMVALELDWTAHSLQQRLGVVRY